MYLDTENWITLKQEHTNFPNIKEPPKNSRRQNGDFNQLPQREHKKFSGYGKNVVTLATWRSVFVHPRFETN